METNIFVIWWNNLGTNPLSRLIKQGELVKKYFPLRKVSSLTKKEIEKIYVLESTKEENKEVSTFKQTALNLTKDELIKFTEDKKLAKFISNIAENGSKAVDTISKLQAFQLGEFLGRVQIHIEEYSSGDKDLLTERNLALAISELKALLLESEIRRAKKILKENNIEVEDSIVKGFDFFVPYNDVEPQDNQSNGTHFTDTDLIEYANEF